MLLRHIVGKYGQTYLIYSSQEVQHQGESGGCSTRCDPTPGRHADQLIKYDYPIWAELWLTFFTQNGDPVFSTGTHFENSL